MRVVAGKLSMRAYPTEGSQRAVTTGDLARAEDELGDVDELLQRAEGLAAAAARAGLEAAAHDAAAHIDVHGRGVLVAQAQRLLEAPDGLCLIAPVSWACSVGTSAHAMHSPITKQPAPEGDIARGDGALQVGVVHALQLVHQLQRQVCAHPAHGQQASGLACLH